MPIDNQYRLFLTCQSAYIITFRLSGQLWMLSIEASNRIVIFNT